MNNRTCTVLFLLFAFWLTVCAQDRPPVGTFKGGVLAGATTSQISGDNLAGFHKLGAMAGVFANCVLVEQPKFGLKLQMEMDFVMKGSHSFSRSGQAVNPMAKYVLNLGYIEVPVLLRFRIARITIRNSSDFEFELGPAFGGIVQPDVEPRLHLGAVPYLLLSILKSSSTSQKARTWMSCANGMMGSGWRLSG